MPGVPVVFTLPWEREGRAQRRKGEAVKTYDEAKTGAVHRARQLRRASTEAEKKLWRALRTKLPHCKWRRQMPVGPYFVDFTCFAERLVIELDGGQHADAAAYDGVRTKFIEAQDFTLLRFWNNEVLSNTDGVIERIAESLSLREREGGAKRREGEVETASTSPSHAFGAGPSLSHGRGMGTLTIQNLAKGAGAVVVGLIALDLVATVITLAIGAEFLKR
jgi:very-short-patch-repair endonuclease